MKFSIVFFSALAGLAIAQSTTTSAHPPINTANIPQCVQECSAKAAQAIGCTTEVTDPACICDPKFLQAVEPCIHGTCNNTDHQAAMSLWQSICGPLPTQTGPISGTHSMPPASSTLNTISGTLTSPGPSSATVVSSATPSTTSSSNTGFKLFNLNTQAFEMWGVIWAGGAVIAHAVF
ncbi:hypothetical protein FRC12_019412 [Ceratobasidium sp. 428]|nr:hypothetical protein FRC12_019412 [Ceratobasidium sp. 428]